MKICVVRFGQSSVIEPFEIAGSQSRILNHPLREVQDHEVGRTAFAQSPILDVPHEEDLGRIVQEGYPVLAFASNLFFSAEFIDRFLGSCMTNSQTSEAFQAVVPMKSRLVKDYIIPDSGFEAHCPMFRRRILSVTSVLLYWDGSGKTNSYPHFC